MSDTTELPEQRVALASPVKVLSRVMGSEPTVLEYRVVRRRPSVFEIELVGEDRVIAVPRSPGQNAGEALRSYLRGGAA